MTTIQDCREYTGTLRKYDGKLTLPPLDVVCVVCGVYLEGSDANVQRHLDWHKQFTRNEIEALLEAI